MELIKNNISVLAVWILDDGRLAMACGVNGAWGAGASVCVGRGWGVRGCV